MSQARSDSSRCFRGAPGGWLHSREASGMGIRGALLAIASLLMLLPPITTRSHGNPSVEGLWTTVSNIKADSSWDILNEDNYLSVGGATHMALFRDRNNSSWVIHWHSGDRARLWKTVPGRDTGLSMNVPLGLDTMQLFCAGHSALGNGRLLVVGGTLWKRVG